MQLSTALAIAFAGFLIGSVFLHLCYPRFFWLLVGIALAIRGLSLARRVAACRSRSSRLLRCDWTP